MDPNIPLVFVADDVSIALNSPSGIDVIWVLENVLENIKLISVAEPVSILLNNPAGMLVMPVL